MAGLSAEAFNYGHCDGTACPILATVRRDEKRKWSAPTQPMPAMPLIEPSPVAIAYPVIVHDHIFAAARVLKAPLGDTRTRSA